MMITDNRQNKQLPNALHLIFKELNVLKHLRKAGIKKGVFFTRPKMLCKSFCWPTVFSRVGW